jgi:CheY-like chemotaxis protein
MTVELNKLQILVVAESVRFRRLVVSILHANRMKIIYETGTAQEGIELLSVHQPGLVIIDNDAGSITGLELMRKIRHEIKAHRRIPIILILDDHVTKDLIDEAKNAGSTGLLLKPFSARELLKQVKNSVNDRRDFIEDANYVGPDRRGSKRKEYEGPLRRSKDMSPE